MRTLLQYTIENKNIKLHLELGPRFSKCKKKLEITLGKNRFSLNGRQITSLRKMLEIEESLA